LTNKLNYGIQGGAKCLGDSSGKLIVDKTQIKDTWGQYMDQ